MTAAKEPALVAMLIVSAMVLRLADLAGTTISHPGMTLALWPTLAMLPFIYMIYVWLFFALLEKPPAWSI
jgi:hypothetical protein